MLGPDIETKIRSYVTGWAADGHAGVLILTGNAGTGKTALVEGFCEALKKGRPEYDGLVEVLRERFVVKDLSGIPEHERADVVQLSAEIRHGRSAQLFLCANEGVLRDALSQSPDSELENFLNTALEGGISRTNQPHGVTIVNMNRQRWTSEKMWDRLLDYFVREDLWEECEGCAVAGRCPIQANVSSLRKPGPREAARRLTQFASGASVSTLRELLSIISYAITGGMSCEEVAAQSTPFNASDGYFNLFMGAGLSRERLERSSLMQEMQSAELGSISDVEVDGWLRDSDSAPKEVGGLAQPAEPTPHAVVKTAIGEMTFHEFGEMISISDDSAKVEACLQDYVAGQNVLQLWRRRIFFESQPALGGWRVGLARLTKSTSFGELLEVATSLRRGEMRLSFGKQSSLG